MRVGEIPYQGVSGRETSRGRGGGIECIMKWIPICGLALFVLAGCTPQQRSPDEIRKDTANATSQAARDAKAVAQGVVDGLRHGGTMNINKASEQDLERLPGITEVEARRIIENRPYENSYELVKKRVISKGEFDHIAEKITAK